MSLERIQERFQNTSVPDEEIQEQLQEEFEDLIEELNRREILERLGDYSQEFRDLARETLDQEIFRQYRQELALDESFNREFEETIEDLSDIFSKEKVLKMAAQRSEEFEEKVREVLS